MDITVGITTHNDYDGVFFTIQALRMYHGLTKFIVIDQCPSSEYGKLTRRFVEKEVGGEYVPYPFQLGPSHGRNEIMRRASGWVLMVDGHVLLEDGAIGIAQNCPRWIAPTDLIQGPLLYDSLDAYATHWTPGWNQECFGTWATDERLHHERPFEIPMQGVGLMLVHTDHWPGYNKDFRGFGGEEWYIHRKYRKQGGRTLCLPGLRWNHRFGRQPHHTYPLTRVDKIYNHFLGDIELEDAPQFREDYAHWNAFDAPATQQALTLLRKDHQTS